MRVDHAAKSNSCALSLRRFSEQIIVLGKAYPSHCRRTVEQIRVRHFVGLVFIGRHYIHLPEPQPLKGFHLTNGGG